MSLNFILLKMVSSVSTQDKVINAPILVWSVRQIDLRFFVTYVLNINFLMLISKWSSYSLL